MFLELLIYSETVPVQYINTELENQNISEYMMYLVRYTITKRLC